MDRSILDIAKEVLVMVFLGILISYLITRAVAPVKVVGSSMYPTYKDGEMLVVNKLKYKFKEPEYGDTIMFKPIEDLGERYLKRIIGLPGDIVEVKNNKIYRNSVPIEEKYINEPMVSENFKEYLLKEDEYFVLGDNRNLSKDSRYFGPVEKKYIIGKIF